MGVVRSELVGTSLRLDIAPSRDFAARASVSTQTEAGRTSPVLSVIIPVYNEHTLGQVLVAVSRALPGVAKHITIVDDCSTDGTREWLKANFPVGPRTGSEINLDGAGRLGDDPSRVPQVVGRHRGCRLARDQPAQVAGRAI